MEITTDSLKSVGSHLTVKLNISDSCGVNNIKYRAYWGVSVTAFYHVLRSPWPWFREAFLKGNLFGSDGCLQLGDLTVNEVRDNDLQSSTSTTSGHENDPILELNFECPQLDLGPAPRKRYPLVLVSKAVRKNSDQPLDEDELFYINVIHIKDESPENPCHFATHVLASFLKHKLGNSKVTHLVPIYSNEETCVVCATNPATRVTLPCRHASLCHRCFGRIRTSQCPMCRTQIQSFFLIKEEPLDGTDEEEDISDQMPKTWRQRLAEFEHRFAMAVGLQEND